MDNTDYNEMYSKKTTEELIELYRQGLRGAVKVELSKRQLTEDQKKIMRDSVITENELQQARVNQSSSQPRQGNRYPALLVIAKRYQAFAILVGLLTIVVVYLFLTQGEAGMIMGIVSLVVGGLIVLGLVAASESIRVFIDIEANTRRIK